MLKLYWHLLCLPVLLGVSGLLLTIVQELSLLAVDIVSVVLGGALAAEQHLIHKRLHIVAPGYSFGAPSSYAAGSHSATASW